MNPFKQRLKPVLPTGYSYEELKVRCDEVKKISAGKLFLSNQHGMLFLLDDNNRIILRLDRLLTKQGLEKAMRD